jgi:serine protein kinase
MLSLSQEGNFKTGRYQLISADEVIIGHTNEHEYRAFKENPRNQALLSRMLVVPVPYNMDRGQEVRIYQKILAPRVRADQHMSLKALETAATAAVCSRLSEENKPGGDRLSKLQRVRAGAPREEIAGARDGFEGMDPRYVINRLAYLLANGEADCVDALEVMDGLLEGATKDPFANSKWVEAVKESVGAAEAWYRAELERDVRKAFVHEGERELLALYHNYVAQLVTSVEGGARTRAAEADERLLRSVEMRLDVSESQKHQFREEIYIAWQDARERGSADALLTRNPMLRGALEEKLFDDFRDVIELSRPDTDSLAWIERAVSAMVASGAYCPRCATRAIRSMGAILKR